MIPVCFAGNLTVEEFCKEVNKLRKENKNKWFAVLAKVEGKDVRLKAYKTYLQIYEVDGVRYGGLMDIKVKEFNTALRRPFI